MAQLQRASTSLLSKLFGITAYLYFLVGLTIWSLWFGVEGLEQQLPTSLARAWHFFAPNSFDPKPPPLGVAGSGDALLNNLALLLAFAVPHSILASSWCKEAMGLPPAVERSFFIFQSMALLHLQMRRWEPLSAWPTLWDVRGSSFGQALQGVYFFGFAFLLTATFALDHFDMFGLSASFGININKTLGLDPKKATKSGLVVRFHYAIVAHPIMTGLMLMLWGAPRMSGSRLLFALFYSAYGIIATKFFEEPRLEHQLGALYVQYLQRTPSFCPYMPPARTKMVSKKS